MDIRKIALELSGKVYPDYKKYNRLEFMEYLEEIFGLSLDKIEFYRRQAKEYEEDFYFLVLDLFYNKSLKDDNEKIKFGKLIDKLDILESDSNILTLGEYSNEADFTQKFLVPFFKKLGYKDVRYIHGTDEKGKDIIMKKLDDLGEYKYIGVQAKLGKIDATANNSGITNLILQAQKGFSNDYDDIEINKRIRISEYFIVTNDIITEKAKDEVLNIEPTYFRNNIHFIDQIKINNLLDEIDK